MNIKLKPPHDSCLCAECFFWGSMRLYTGMIGIIVVGIFIAMFGK